MSASSSPSRAAAIRTKIHAFARKKPIKKAPTITAWIELTAERATRIQYATHIVKGIHSGASGTSIWAEPSTLPPCEELGTHCLGEDLELDVAIENGRESGVYSFLQEDIGGQSLLEGLQREDAAVLRALHDDEEEARRLRECLLSLLHPKQASPASHSYAKQVYWCVDETHEEGFVYHLLAPLYPSSLVHKLYNSVESAYSNASFPARQAWRDKKHHPEAVHDYRNLAIQQIVASHPHNVSYIMSKQTGRSYLLSSAPPHWKSSEVRVPTCCESIFDRVFSGREAVRQDRRALRRFLRDKPPKRWENRRRREHYVDNLVGELIQMADDYHRALLPSWSRSPKVELPREECLWLDPYRARISEEIEFRQDWMRMEWVEQIAQRFARWLNAQLQDEGLPVGDGEYHEWMRELLQTGIEGYWEKVLYKNLSQEFSASVKTEDQL